MSDQSQPQPDVEPAVTPEQRLARNLSLITTMAKRAGAEGIFILRGAEFPTLTYELGDDLAPLEMSIATCPTLIIIRFPNDGGEPGVEHF
jgi:hypothetical protein